MKIAIITSPGGHLQQILLLKPWWQRHQVFFVSLKSPDALDILSKQPTYWAHGPESRNLINAIKNLFLGYTILNREKPQLIFSMGAGIAPPFFLAGKILKIPSLYIEPFDFVDQPSLTAKMSKLIGATTLVQHQSLLSKMKGAHYWGSVI